MAFDGPQPSGPGAFAGRCIPAPNTQIRRLLSRWGPSSTEVNPTPMQTPANDALIGGQRIRAAKASNSEPCWWAAEVNAIEVNRPVVPPATGASPLTVDQTKQFGGSCSKLWAEVGWHREGIGRRVVFDISAGMRITVQACDVEINIIRPFESVSVRGSNTPGGFSITSAEDTFLEGTGLFLDTLIRTSLICGCAPIFGRAKLTQTVILPAGITGFLPCVPGAVGVQIFVPGAAFPNAGTWVEHGSVSSAFPPSGALGFIPFLTIAADRTGNVSMPGNAAGIGSTNAAGVPLAFTYVWDLEF